MVRAQTMNGKTDYREVEAQRKLLDAWSSDEDSDEIEFDASRVLEKPLSIKAKQHGRVRRPRPQCVRTEVSLCVILTLAICIIFLLMGAVGWLFIKQLSFICMFTQCIEASAHISQLMDQSVEPCHDFYNFTCGHFNRYHPIQPNEAEQSWFKILRDQDLAKLQKILSSPDLKFQGQTSTSLEKMKIYYKSCMNEAMLAKAGIQPLIKLIEKYGGWTITPHIDATWWQSKNYNLTSLLIGLHRLSIHTLFNMHVSVDEKNDTHVIKFAEGGLMFGDEKFYTDHSAYKFIDALQKFIPEFADITGVRVNKERMAMSQQFRQIWDFETALAMLYPPREAVNDPWKMYKVITVGELKKKIGKAFDLDAYLLGMFGKPLPSTTRLRVSFPEYFTKLSALIQKTPQRTVTNYMIWRLAETVLSFVNPMMREAHVRLFSVKTGVSTPVPRWKFCTSLSGEAFGFMLSGIYVKKHVTSHSIDTAKNIVQYVREGLKESIEHVSWMDEQTRNLALAKLDKLEVAVGYPDWILDHQKQEDYYSNFSISDEFLMNHLYTRKFFLHRNIIKLTETPDRTEWHILPYEQNAYYSLTYNKMVVPAGLFESPFLDLTLPMSYNFGSLGMFIGHEMSHGFDVRGRHYDEQGKLKHWWTDDVLKKYGKISDCVIKFYSNFTAFGVTLNGKYTVNENIADDGGLKIAYRGYQRWKNDHGWKMKLPALDYTPDQFVYIGFGQAWCTSYTPTLGRVYMKVAKHPLHPIRVRGAVSNSKTFSEVFQCPVNIGMNPEKKCDVWGS